MRIVPDSTITLYRGVDIDNDEQLVFKNINNQNAYFQSKIYSDTSGNSGAYTPCTVVRKTGRLRVEKPGYVVAACNYLSFVNPSFDNKTIYARIIDYNYVNNECVEIDYMIDYWQTWMFDVTFQDMYIEREHLSQAEWTLAEENPYDPSILEFRTNETLPVTKDIEKPFYHMGAGVATEDGAFVGARVREQYELNDGVGILVVFSNVNLSDLDSTNPGNPPSVDLSTILKQTTYSWSVQNPTYVRRENLSAFSLTRDTCDYLSNVDSTFANVLDTRFNQPYQSTGEKWDTEASTLGGHFAPFNTNRVKAPVNYVYFDPVQAGSASTLLNWFTDTDKLDSVIGVYGIPTGLMLLSGVKANDHSFRVAMATASGQEVINKKLDLYPYTYYRLIAPNGDIKELRIEDFNTAQTEDDDCSVGLSMDIVEKPNLLIAPIMYKASGMAPHNITMGMNSVEGMVFSQFPCLPYDIDGFRSQMAAVANSIIGNNTIESQNAFEYESKKTADTFWKKIASVVSNTVLTATSLLSGNGTGGNFVPAVSSAMDAANIWGYEKPAIDNEAKMRNQASDVLTGGTDNAIYENFQYTRPAYAAAIYHPINGDGVLNYNMNAFCDILFMRVSINPTILEQYDRYFTNYGYASGRCGIPRVINYTRGITADTSVPHWQTLNGKPTTFIKTRDCKVIHSMLPVASFIKQMFDNGVRMIQGDPNNG